MNPNQKAAKIVGILFLLSAITGILGIILNGLPLSFADSPKLLYTVFENSSNINISILCDVITNTFSVSLAVLLFSVIQKLNQRIALWYWGFSLIAFTVMVIGNISLISLLSLSHEYVKPGLHDSGYFQTFAILRQDEYFGTHFMGLIVDSLGALPFYYLLYQSKLIPRFLSAWGLIAATLVLVTTWLQVFGQDVSLLLYLPNGLFILFLGIWLIVKGFNFSAVVFESTE
jgi:hypothetical protein